MLRLRHFYNTDLIRILTLWALPHDGKPSVIFLHHIDVMLGTRRFKSAVLRK